MRDRCLSVVLILGCLLVSGCIQDKEVIKLYECPSGQLVDTLNKCPKKITTTSTIRIQHTTTITILSTTSSTSSTSTTSTSTSSTIMSGVVSDSISGQLPFLLTLSLENASKFRNYTFVLNNTYWSNGDVDHCRSSDCWKGCNLVVFKNNERLTGVGIWNQLYTPHTRGMYYSDLELIENKMLKFRLSEKTRAQLSGGKCSDLSLVLYEEL